MDLATAVRTRRRELKLTQEELADLAQVAERTVRAIEAGKQTVQLDKALQVLRAVGLEFAVQVHVPEALR
ncbi:MULTISPECIES: type II toxin-antitoxin system Y4mF family antitoxin [unclassified Corynebacterium]|uniref:type II toxin-antitoxin system Y4mF family antitoxin n=1 Tax=unclassified Corynebacterium TaxID=2624378 RepID=UPI002A91221F|nr:type II toxin-antitoxin system Y4mF family antitoxin [Corynebacterium sp.]MDY5786203.1 type II toxin-antitoxin system Y4mF family antitoxin [Corynebacterium sp.]